MDRVSGLSLYMELEQTCEQLEQVTTERDTARGLAVRLEQDNAQLIDLLRWLALDDARLGEMQRRAIRRTLARAADGVAL